MKILQITSHLNVGGITRYILALSKQLLARGHQVVIASGGGELELQVREMGIEHWRVPFKTSAEFSPQVFWGIRELAARLGVEPASRSEPVDLIHAHTRVGQVVAARISRRLNIPYVTTWHGIYKRRLSRKLWPCTGRMTIAISGPVRQHLQEYFQIPEERIRCIYNGIDTAHYASAPDPSAVERYRESHQIPAGRPVIGGIGRLAAGRVKGFDSLLVSAHLLKKTFPDIQVLIVGDGPRRPFLEDVARRLGVRDQVRFLGASGDVRLPLALMDVFIFSSRWPEAFGLTLVEAMAAAKPVVATKVGAVPEIVEHNVSGWLVPVEDPDSLAQGIARLLRDRATASRLGRAAQIRAREMFSVDRMVSEIEQVYREVCVPLVPGTGGTRTAIS
ncbi:MAG: glycosyltransferase family 4 protein [Candidatus Omnitrophica bacterium]|nr:glycosyltransferase family 4 protein [Candidatus Omnitrophota bacterium]